MNKKILTPLLFFALLTASTASAQEPTCSISFNPNPVAYGSSATLSWVSYDPWPLWVQNVGYVSPTGSTSVAPTALTDYSCYSRGWYYAYLAVTPPATPVVRLTASSYIVPVGASTTITATFAAGSGDTLSGANIDSPVGSGLAANEDPAASKAYVYTPTASEANTTVIFYGRAKTTYYTSWGTYDTVSITVPPLPTCTISFSSNPISSGQSVTLSYESSNAATFSINNVGTLTPNTSSSVTVAPTQSTDYTGTVQSSYTSVSAPQRVYLTSGSSWTVPSDWNSSNNTVEVVGGGGGGGSGASNDYGAGGAGGGAYSKISNLALTPSASVSYSVGSGGATASAGGATYLSGSSCGSSAVCALGGSAGGNVVGNAGGASGAGGSASGGVGTVRYSGGAGGSGGYQGGAGGGGGAAGKFGSGVSGVSATAGAGDAGVGGQGAPYLYSWSGLCLTGQTGGIGNEWASGRGSGGGGGAGNGSNGGVGGLYGGGGGGGGTAIAGGCSQTGGYGAPGIIVITYHPAASTLTQTVTCKAPTGTPEGTLNVSCAPLYYCSGSTIMYRNSSCENSTITTCAAPASCINGQSSCTYPAPSFVPGSGGTGHLKAAPQIVRKGHTTKLFWNVAGVSSCSVTGTNGDSFSGLSSGTSGQTTSEISRRTIYTLSCEPYEGHTFTNENVTINIVPNFEER